MSNVKIQKYDEGPYVIEGSFELIDGKGSLFNVTETVALCRCGNSKSQPFCDSTHRSIGFKETSEAR